MQEYTENSFIKILLLFEKKMNTINQSADEKIEQFSSNREKVNSKLIKMQASAFKIKSTSYTGNEDSFKNTISHEF